MRAKVQTMGNGDGITFFSWIDPIFFTSSSLKKRKHEKPLGVVLSPQGLVNEAVLDEALTEQKELRNRRVGEIIAERAEVPQIIVEQAIDNAVKNGKKPQFRVGDILAETGLVTNQQVEEALQDQASGKRKRIGLILIEKRLITEDQLLEALAHKFGLKVIDLEETQIDPQALKKVPRDRIIRMQSLPISLQGITLTVATANPTDPTASENLRFATNCQIELVCASTTQLGEKIADIFDQNDDSVEDLIDELEDLDVEVDDEPEIDKITESDSKVINLVNKVLLEASNKDISDIHFEPCMGPQPLKIRYRRDGICYTVHQIAATYKAAVISRLKIFPSSTLPNTAALNR
jgi:hypothetical protein